jgi:hypothetical protein
MIISNWIKIKNKSTLGLLSVILIGVIIQFFRIDKSAPESDPALDFFVVANPPRRIIAIFKTSCYDCHSYKTRYPWYSNVAPVSWILKSQIKNGLEHLNFSEYGNYSREESNLALAEMKKKISEKEMPPKSYLIVHKEARLSSEKRGVLIKWMSAGKNDVKMP